MRINKFFSDKGVCSRREADKLIEEGRISINGKPALLGDQIQDGDSVTLDGKEVGQNSQRKVILAYNKAPGIVCTSDKRVKDNIIDAVAYPERIFHIGRLDQYSEGLILLTNRGDIVNKILRSRYNKEKEYVVTLTEVISDANIQKLREGIFLDGQKTKNCAVTRLAKDKISMILTEGRNRQIRRMVESIEMTIKKLKRIRIMNIHLGDLEMGKWRELSHNESEGLLKDLSPGD